MGWTRREMLELGAKLGVLSLGASGCDPNRFVGCDPEVVDWSWSGEPGPDTLFSHGVASGDPLVDSVILWTRVTPDADGDVEVFWQVSLTSDFAEILASGITSTGADRDYTVKVEATCLRPDTTYYYRFQAQGRTSVIGRTRTAPHGETQRVKFAFCSCSNYAYGWFHGYRAIAEHADLNLVLHLGDYIYEYGDGQYGDARPLDPPHEIITLEDYRRRHALHKADPDLQEAHRQHPFVCTWDDHETADNSWSGGASNHQADEGSWAERKSAGLQAYLEWLPIREGAQGVLYRRLTYGDLLDFIVLDTRIHGRDAEAESQEEVYAPERQLLGVDQESWLLERLDEAVAPWTVLAQQVVMADWSLAQDDEGRALPLNRDAWGGYFAARQRVLDRVAELELPGFVVLTGDVHSSWANDIAQDFIAYEEEDGATALGVEAVCPGITSPGAGGLEGALMEANPHVRWGESGLRGFVLVEATTEHLQADWHLLPEGAIDTETYVAPTVHASFRVGLGEGSWSEASGPIPSAAEPPLAP